VFTGIVEGLAEVVRQVPEPPGLLVALAPPWPPDETAIGESICVNGCCLTVVDRSGGLLSFQAGPETLTRTTLGELRPGARVNVERSLRATDRLGGHLVTGHVDAVGSLALRRDEGDWTVMWFDLPPCLSRYLAPKGSIAVDGVSLTLVDVLVDRFSVALIPHTLSATTLGAIGPGGRVNLETDLLAKYVERQLAWRLQGDEPSPGVVDRR
jgi:riboflavin synthase